MRTLLLLGFLAATALLLPACGSAEKAPFPDELSPWINPTSPPSPLKLLPFETVEQGDQSGVAVEEPDVFSLGTQEQWEKFWSRHKSGVIPVPDLPEVDFTKEMVIAVVDGQEPSGGYRIEIAGIAPDLDSLTVMAKKTVPGRGCVVAAVITQPFHIVRTAESIVSADLDLVEETHDCE